MTASYSGHGEFYIRPQSFKKRSYFQERGCPGQCFEVGINIIQLSLFLTKFYARNLYKGYAKNTQDKKKRKQTFCKKIAHVYNPAAALVFVFIYWAVGLKNAQFY